MEDSLEYETVELRTGIDPLFFAETLTTDVELVDALYDLIDNSIDAARNQIIANLSYKKDRFGLPNDYSGFHVKILFTPDSIVISDNCVGIDSDTIEKRTFYTGEKSRHQYGIGHYGLGLKRALLKAGRRFSLSSDNGVNLYVASFKHDALSGDKTTPLVAQKYPSSSKEVGTVFSAYDLKADTINQITSREWFEDAISHLSIRYSIFIDKGFKIELESECFPEEAREVISPGLPSIRNEKIFPEASSHMKEGEVDVYFRVGAHGDYRFSGEEEYNKKVNNKITKEFGIYFICNDRVIVSHSFEKKHGFTTAYHSEYGGFLCYVYMVSENPGSLPWNTAKTEIKIHSPLFVAAKNKIEPLAKSYRSKARVIIKVWTDPATKKSPMGERKRIFRERLGLEKSSGNKSDTSRTLSNASSVDSEAGLRSSTSNANAAGKNTKRHTQNWTELLPEHFPISSRNSVLDNMIIEASSLGVNHSPHAACMLYRSLLEGALKHYASQTKRISAIKEHYYTQGEGKTKNHSESYKKSQNIDLSMTLHWLLDNGDVFPVEERKKLLQCVKHARKHAKKLNGVVHCLEIVSGNEVIAIRNETIGLLEFLVSLGVTS